jgi:hypothetical protein
MLFFISCGAGSRCLFSKGKRSLGGVKGNKQIFLLAALLAVLRLGLVEIERRGQSRRLEGGRNGADPRPLQRG